MNIVESMYSQYGDKPSDGQHKSKEGNAYLEKSYPKLDFIKTATIVPAEEK